MHTIGCHVNSTEQDIRYRAHLDAEAGGLSGFFEHIILMSTHDEVAYHETGDLSTAQLLLFICMLSRYCSWRRNDSSL